MIFIAFINFNDIDFSFCSIQKLFFWNQKTQTKINIVLCLLKIKKSF